MSAEKARSAVRDSFVCRYCGTNIPPMLLSSNSRMLVEYTRSAGQSGTGFVANYQAACGGKFKARKGIVIGPNYLKDRLPNNECIWRIEVPVGFSILFRFYTFHIGPDRPECLNEYLEILDGPSESSTLLRKLCGSSVPRAVRSSNNTMTVRFVANGLTASEQFGGKFQKQRALRDYLKADEGNFTSPGYPPMREGALVIFWKGADSYDQYNLLHRSK
ncbi:Bone morphoproteintic protein 1 [Sparganum proliferum]